MAGLTLTLETAKGTLLNSQVQIQTTSHNIANADNKAYARQKAVLTTNPAYRMQGGWVGTGASVNHITQQRDRFIEQRLMDSVAAESEHSTIASQMALAQTSFSDDGENGLSQVLGAFWDSWDTLVQNPEGLPEQNAVYDATQRLVDTIRHTHDDLTALTDPVDGQMPKAVQGEIDKANDLIKQIADTNREIMRSETPEHQANDLRDLRIKALRELSEVIPIQYTEGSHGSIEVHIRDGTGVSVISGSQYGSIDYDTNTKLFSYVDTEGTPVEPASNSLSGGSLKGLVTAQTNVEGILQRLNDFTSTLITEVNALHDAGAGPVFEGTAGAMDAGDIGMISDFLNKPDPLDPVVETGQARKIAELQDAEVTFPGGKASRFSEFLSDVQQRMGLEERKALDQASFNASLRMELEAQQQSVSGVSLDEEMVELLKHQQVYQAAAKIIERTAEMLNAVIDMV